MGGEVRRQRLGLLGPPRHDGQSLGGVLGKEAVYDGPGSASGPKNHHRSVVECVPHGLIQGRQKSLHVCIVAAESTYARVRLLAHDGIDGADRLGPLGHCIERVAHGLFVGRRDVRPEKLEGPKAVHCGPKGVGPHRRGHVRGIYALRPKRGVVDLG